MIGDLAGSAAACYQRGVAFIQIPTTLLAQVDSRLAAKPLSTTRSVKYDRRVCQPLCVLADTDTLSTLLDRELSAGLAEVIKYGLDPMTGRFWNGWKLTRRQLAPCGTPAL